MTPANIFLFVSSLFVIGFAIYFNFPVLPESPTPVVENDESALEESTAPVENRKSVYPGNFEGDKASSKIDYYSFVGYLSGVKQDTSNVEILDTSGKDSYSFKLNAETICNYQVHESREAAEPVSKEVINCNDLNKYNGQFVAGVVMGSELKDANITFINVMKFNNE